MIGLVLALIAAVAMVVQDILGVIFVMASTRGRGRLAGSMDATQWLVGITTTTISVNALSGHSWSEKILVVVLVTAANYFGTVWGEKIGSRYVKGQYKTMEERMLDVEDEIKNRHQG